MNHKFQNLQHPAGFRKQTLTLAVSTGMLLAISPVYADTGEPTVELEPIVITATRTPTKTSNLIAQTTVIDENDLQRYQGQTVLDVLKSQAGFNVKQDGGLGASSNFYLRGYDSKQVLVLIDGVRYQSATLGSPALNLLSTEQIDRIEILHGASGSSIYGTDAVGGVIQIFTKGSDKDDSHAQITAGIGSHDHYSIGANGQYVTNDTNISAGISHSRTDGFNAVKKGANNVADRDGFELSGAHFSMSNQLTDTISTGMTAFYNQSETDYDTLNYNTYSPYPYSYSEQENGAFNTFVEYKDDVATTRFTHGYSMDYLTAYNDGINDQAGNQYNTIQQQSRLDSRVHLSDSANVILGAEYNKQKVNASTAYSANERDTKSIFAGYQLADDNWDFQANYRSDSDSQYGRQNTYNIGTAIRTDTNLRIGVNYSTGFRAPNFNELYFPSSGNPNLKPETSENKEIFIEYEDQRQRTRLTGYKNNIENLIAYVSTPTPSNPWAGTNMNINEAEVTGLSLTTDWNVNNVLFGAGYDYINSENLDTNNKGNQLVYRPEKKATAYIGYATDYFDLRLEGEYVDEQYSDVGNKTKLDDYTLLNINSNFYLNDNLTLGMRMNNVANEEYTISNQFGTEYATDGRNYFVSLTYDY